MAKLYLVRHADAGHRRDFDGPDRERPLSERGWRQAEGLAEQLADAGIVRLLASPFLRCMQTLEPLARRVGIPVEPERRLAEGSGAVSPLELAEQLRAAPVVLCSHGDVIPDVLDELVRRGVALEDDLRWQKGSAWAFSWNGDRIRTGRYLAPPPT